MFQGIKVENDDNKFKKIAQKLKNSKQKIKLINPTYPLLKEEISESIEGNAEC